jgi:hypothetical protein
VGSSVHNIHNGNVGSSVHNIHNGNVGSSPRNVRVRLLLLMPGGLYYLSMFQIIVKVPYPDLGDRWIDAKRMAI